MNIWALQKDNSIKHLLLLLEDELGQGAVELTLDADEDQRAIRLSNPEDKAISLYVYTYGQEEEHYGAHIEYPNLEETNASDTVEIYDNLSFELLLDILKTDLGIECKETVAAGG